LRGPSTIIEAAGVPLGVARGVAYQLCETSFVPDSMLLLYSDGLPEFPDDYGDRIGEAGLLEAVVNSPSGLPPHETIDRLCRAAGISPNCVLPDDTTIICIDRRATAAASSCRDCMFIEAAPPLSPNVCSAVATTAVSEP
jgi:sigma-B regulation protein RsbU (phosphoserine phosphatase)